MKLVLICGPWGSGTSAVAGVLERLGATGVPPYLMTNDHKTPNSYESIPFADALAGCVDGASLSFSASARSDLPSKLRTLRRRIEQQELGIYDIRSPKPVFVKHPLAALVIPEICEVFGTRLIYVMRPLEDIERTRLRRYWLPHYGALGAAVIYEHMSAAAARAGDSLMTLDYRDLSASPEACVRALAQFASLEPTETEIRNAVDFITPGGR